VWAHACNAFKCSHVSVYFASIYIVFKISSIKSVQIAVVKRFYCLFRFAKTEKKINDSKVLRCVEFYEELLTFMSDCKLRSITFLQAAKKSYHALNI